MQLDGIQKKIIYKQEANGTITVFLTLILLLILSLLFTIIEGARISTAKVFAERSLTTAMDSVLAEYYGPLWEEYHIFGFNTGEGNDVEQKEQIATKTADYMSYTFAPDKELDELLNKNNTELYDVSVDLVGVNNETMLMDYQGKLIINEAIEYMKYKEIGDGLELLLDKMSLLGSPKEVSAIYKEKEEVEKELVEIDEGILKLMELLDGIKTSKKGIKISKEGDIITSEYFAKKFCFEEVTKESVAINQDNLFLALKNKYDNPSQDFETINSNFTRMEHVLQRLEQIKIEQADCSVTLLSLQDQLAELNSINKKTKEVKQQIKRVNKSINNLAACRENLRQETSEQETIKSQLIVAIRSTKNNLKQLIDEIIPLLNEAISISDHLVYKTGIAEPLVDKYEEALYVAKGSLGEDVFAGLEDSLKYLKQYTSTDLDGYDFVEMMNILEYNRLILMDVEGILKEGVTELTQERYQASKATFTNAENRFKSYQIRELAIDYSTLVLDKSKQKDPLSEMKNILQAGITSLVIDPDIISKDELSEELLPSIIAAMDNEDTDFLSVLTAFFEDTIIGGNKSGMSSLFYNFDEPDEIMSMVGNGVNKVAEHVIYQEYLTEHYAMFPKEGENLKARKPSVLTYEQEYLLNGKMSDQENLSAIITKIIFYRTILDFVSILGDKAKCNEAKLVATSLVGFTGLPILIGITQTIILLIWGFVEALTDVCALMKGKEVPVLKKNLVTKFADLFLINRSHLQSKASQIVADKELSLSYQDYLRIFLLMKNKEDLAYRSMDLIQENINLRYEEVFHMENCLYGYQLKADFSIQPKFTCFSFVQKYLNSRISRFQFSIEATYSY